MFSCKDCVAPKRHPGCHGTCEIYLAERAEYDRRKAIADRQRDIAVAFILDRRDKVYEAMKSRRNKRI